jgi:hypothetical protein
VNPPQPAQHVAEPRIQPIPAAGQDPGAKLARLIHQAVKAKLPRVYEDASGWGQTTPLPERLRLPRARRTVVMVDGRPEVPDGLWRKLRLRVENPDRDLRVRVRSLDRLDATHYRLRLDADADLRVDADLQRWRNGLLLADLTAQTRVSLDVFLECAITARMDAASVPPLRLEPEIKDLKVNVKDFKAGQVTFLRAGMTLGPEALQGLNDELKEAVQAQLRAQEPEIKKRAEEALAQAFKEGGKGPITLPALLDAVGPLLKAADGPRQKK